MFLKFPCLSICTDVGLGFGNMQLPNNSVFYLEDLTDTSVFIQCISTLSTCCDTVRAGNWFFPSGGPVTLGMQLFPTWHDDRTIRLIRYSSSGSFEEGIYRCNVPDANNEIQMLYLGIYPTSRDGECD